MSKVGEFKTTVIGFAKDWKAAWTSTATLLGEPKRGEEMTRVMGTFSDVADPNRRVVIAMTPQEARNYAAWLTLEADYADYLNEGREEDVEPRVKHPEDQ